MSRIDIHLFLFYFVFVKEWASLLFLLLGELIFIRLYSMLRLLWYFLYEVFGKETSLFLCGVNLNVYITLSIFFLNWLLVEHSLMALKKYFFEFLMSFRTHFSSFEYLYPKFILVRYKLINDSTLFFFSCFKKVAITSKLPL